MSIEDKNFPFTPLNKGYLIGVHKANRETLINFCMLYSDPNDIPTSVDMDMFVEHVKAEVIRMTEERKEKTKDKG